MEKNNIGLQGQYPETITLEQLYRICHISKRKAKWLLENKVIPCVDSGKKTRRFKIKLTDVISYIEKEQAGNFTALFPVGAFSANYKARDRRKKCYIDEIWGIASTPEGKDALRRFYEKKYRTVSDLLFVKDITEITGFSKSAVNNWINRGRLQAYGSKRNRIPKTFFIDFLCSRYYICLHRQTDIQRTNAISFLDTMKK